MKRYTISVVMLCMFFLFSVSGCSTDKNSVSDNKFDSEHRAKIFLITKDKISPYWKALDEGCRQAADELGMVEYEWRAPAEREAVEQSICIDTAVEDGANAILISAVSKNDINASLEKAAAAGVKIIYVDDAASFEYVATLMTDNKIAGETAGETMLRAFRERNITGGTIGVVAEIPDAFNTSLRDEGFRKALADSGFTVAPTIYTGGDFQVAKKNIAEHTDYVGFFGTNQSTTLLLGNQAKSFADKKIIVGFDVMEDILKLVSDGTIYATMKQNTNRMGYEGINVAVSALTGRYNKKNVNIDTGVTVVTIENLEQVRK